MKIQAIYSSSRLGFDDWFNSVMRMVQNLGIPTLRASGGYWEQRITEAIESCQEDMDYILIMDGDSWFLPGHIQMLQGLIEAHPEYDAIAPVQVRRSDNSPLFSLDKPKGQLTIAQIRKRENLLPLRTAHFGLTIFKHDCFARIPKPWFWSQPNKDGEWAEGKMDADTYFWHKFKIAGLKVGLAVNVCIAHLQLVATFPDVIEHEYRPIHVMMGDLEAGKIPHHCVPS